MFPEREPGREHLPCAIYGEAGRGLVLFAGRSDSGLR
jgi:hypothetical protein